MIATIILAGGAGTRFWPLSRKDKPKQLLKLFSNKTLLEQTIDRMQSISDNIVISTGKHLEKQIKEQVPEKELIVETERRDTAAAIGLCATRFDDEDILVFLPSDAYIDDNEKFRNTIKKAIEKSEEAITLVGVEPDRPATCYGYIEPENNEAIKSFREKPDKDTAKKYIENGFLWNAGIFVVKASIIKDLFRQHEPEMLEKLEKITKDNIDEIYPTLKKTSFDYAIMEKAEKINYVKADFYWNDIGSFDALTDIIEGKNAIIKGDVKEIESKGNIISSDKTVALIGCNNMVVIDTKDALLVCPKEKVEKIKQMNEKIEEELK
ncbi:MAG: mannose-1-phosphate guanylyltransferase [Nanobdellota archaeon]